MERGELKRLRTQTIEKQIRRSFETKKGVTIILTQHGSGFYKVGALSGEVSRIEEEKFFLETQKYGEIAVFFSSVAELG